MNSYVVATIKDWNIKNYSKYKSKFPGKWHLIDQKDKLTIEALAKISPRYIFFPHWSWIVPEEILNRFECVCFHMADVPYGRGGSPLQNLIVRGHRDTKLSALRMTNEIDAGPVYIKKDLSLNGSAREIFLSCSDLTFQIIEEIIAIEPEPVPQSGEIVYFERRTAKDSELPTSNSIERIYDLIRMLDAETYPKAFLNYGDFRLEFDGAEIQNGDSVVAKVKITKRKS